jgi:hypothetical protein
LIELSAQFIGAGSEIAVEFSRSLNGFAQALT